MLSFALIAAFLWSGCATTVVRWGGNKPSVIESGGAAAFDVVTSPVQVPLILGSAISDQNSKRKKSKRKERYDFVMQQIKSDPNIIFRQGWHTSDDLDVNKAIQNSFNLKEVPYTDKMLRKIHKESVLHGHHVFYHPSCSREFLVEAFPEAWRLAAEHINHSRLAAIVSNENTPRYLVQKVADSKTLGVGAVDAARAQLEKRDT